MLLATKLFIPPLRPQTVARQRLLTQMESGLQGKVTLVSAPAGFGKTTLTAVFTTHATQPTAWLSLDDADNDPNRFFSYLLAALQTVQPELGQTAQAMLQAPPGPPLEGVLTAVLNDLVHHQQNLIIVLDDYHVIYHDRIHQAMGFFVEQLPPNVHLIITSRALPPFPLSRLRARGQLREVRATDLRFTLPEAEAFFQQTAAAVSLTPSQIATLEARTEGWATGLQLAALSLQKQPNIEQFIETFGGTHHYVLDYLVDEVISQQPPDVQDFLLQTAVLERFCAPLCETVLEIKRLGDRETYIGSTDTSTLTLSSPTQAILSHLANTNLFIIPLDNERSWYRYHHLFADFLRARLIERSGQTAVHALHQRAANWYASHGYHSDAIHHALAGEDFAAAANWIVQLADQLWTRGELLTLETWLDKLPDTIQTAFPQTALYKAWCLFLTGQYAPDGAAMLAEAAAILARTERRMATQTVEPAVWEMVFAMQTAVVSLRQDLPRTLALGEKTLAQQPSQTTIWRGVAMVSLGVAQRYTGQLAAATTTFADAAQLCQASNNLYGAIYAYDNLAALLSEQGQLQAAYSAYDDALQLAASFRAERLPIVGLLYIGQGKLLWSWNRVAEAAAMFDKGIKLYATGGFPVAEAQLVQVAILAQQDEQTKSAALLEAVAQAVVAQAHLPQMMAAAQRGLAEMGWRQGNAIWVDNWQRTLSFSLADPPQPQLEADYLLLARLSPRPEAAEGLAHLLKMARASGRLQAATGLLIGLAMIQAEQGKMAVAQQHLLEAIGLAEPSNEQQAFLVEGEPMAKLLRQIYAAGKKRPLLIPPQQAHLETILRAFPQAAETAVSQPLVEPLSNRELEILQLIVAGHSNRVIADQLIVALSTVKWHINNIYGKLGVRTRTQAVAKARQLKIG